MFKRYERKKTFKFSDRKNLSIYFKLVEICKEINKDEALKKNKRNVSVIQDVDVIYIGSDLPKEYTGSKYTYSMRGTNAKAKATAAAGITELIEIAIGKH